VECREGSYALALSRKSLVLECGDWIEVVEPSCGGGGSTRTVKRQALIDAKWDAAKESYVLGSGQLFSVSGMPTQLKDEIERIRISGKTEGILPQLEENLKKQRFSERVLSAYDLLAFAVVVATFLWILSLPQPMGIFLPAAAFIGLLVARPRFAKRFAPWSGFLSFEDLLFIRVGRAVKGLDRFLVDGKTLLLDEATKSLLSTSSLTSTWTTRTLTSRLGRQVAEEVNNIRKNITTRIVPHVRQSKDPKTFNQLALGRLKGLLPILAKPDIAAIASWNEAVRNEFPIAGGQPKPAAFGRELLSKPRAAKVFTLISILLVGYVMALLILFGYHSLLAGHLLQASDFVALLKVSSSTYLLVSNGLAGLIGLVWLRK
jgi:hypothetical protein